MYFIVSGSIRISFPGNGLIRKIVVLVIAYGTLGYRHAKTCANIPPRPLDEKCPTKFEPMRELCLSFFVFVLF